MSRRGFQYPKPPPLETVQRFVERMNAKYPEHRGIIGNIIGNWRHNQSIVVEGNYGVLTDDDVTKGGNMAVEGLRIWLLNNLPPQERQTYDHFERMSQDYERSRMRQQQQQNPFPQGAQFNQPPPQPQFNQGASARPPQYRDPYEFHDPRYNDPSPPPPEYADPTDIPTDENTWKSNYYEILGLNRGATIAEVKKAYKALALEFHSDRTAQAENRDELTEFFKQINEARQVLGSQGKKGLYDAIVLSLPRQRPVTKPVAIPKPPVQTTAEPATASAPKARKKEHTPSPPASPSQTLLQRETKRLQNFFVNHKAEFMELYDEFGDPNVETTFSGERVSIKIVKPMILKMLEKWEEKGQFIQAIIPRLKLAQVIEEQKREKKEAEEQTVQQVIAEQKRRLAEAEREKHMAETVKKAREAEVEKEAKIKAEAEEKRLAEEAKVAKEESDKKAKEESDKKIKEEEDKKIKEESEKKPDIKTEEGTPTVEERVNDDTDHNEERISAKRRKELEKESEERRHQYKQHHKEEGDAERVVKQREKELAELAKREQEMADKLEFLQKKRDGEERIRKLEEEERKFNNTSDNNIDMSAGSATAPAPPLGAGAPIDPKKHVNIRGDVEGFKTTSSKRFKEYDDELKVAYDNLQDNIDAYDSARKEEFGGINKDFLRKGPSGSVVDKAFLRNIDSKVNNYFSTRAHNMATSGKRDVTWTAVDTKLNHLFSRKSII